MKNIIPRRALRSILALLLLLTLAISFLPVAQTLADAPVNDEPVAGEPAAGAPAEITNPQDAENAEETNQPGEVLTGEQIVPSADQAQALLTLGSVDEGSPYKLKLEISTASAGVKQIYLTDYMTEVAGKDHYQLMVNPKDDKPAAYSYAIVGVAYTTEDGEFQRWLSQTDGAWQVDDSFDNDESTGVRLTRVVNDAQSQPLVRIERTYVLKKGLYEVSIDQRVVNITDQAEGQGKKLTVRLIQFGQGDMIQDTDYLGGKREIATGYFDTEADPLRETVYVSASWLSRTEVAKQKLEQLGKAEGWLARMDGRPVWANKNIGGGDNIEPVWAALTNRYFAVVTHLPVKKDAPNANANGVRGIESEFKLGLYADNLNDNDDATDRLWLMLVSQPDELEPGQATELNLQFFAGPREKDVFTAEPYAFFNFDELRRYNIGGCCTFFTFQWLAKFLRAMLSFFHDYLVFDWGIAIILLVLVVRLLLHPITKKSQINMTKFSKQMQALQPELNKLKEKYKNDSKKLQQEQMKLWKEAGINPGSFAMGCLPMFLQMPIWVALYAMLFFAIELRHEAAFYGIFQVFNGWTFLADLSAPDYFIKFGDGQFTVPYLSMIFPLHLTKSINILPIFMAVTFIIQQHYMSPPTATDEQKSQQRMMRIVMLFFPLFFYTAPSGLTLYIMASTLAGIADGYLVRRHIKAQEEAGTLLQKKEPKKNGFMSRLMKAAEERQKMLQERQKPVKGGKRNKRR